MTFQPVLHPLVLVPLCVAAVGAAVWFGLIKSERSRWVWIPRILLLLACFFVALRPGLPGGTSERLATNVDVLVVVDTTASIVAEDWDGDSPRLDGIRADVRDLIAQYPGARFALITFDRSAQLRLPFTTDTTALMSSMNVMTPEVTDQSQGTSITVAHSLVAQTLENAAESASDRARMVFYFGDGEHTAESEQESFASAADLVDGGAVFGYGTAEGGPMKTTRGWSGYDNDSDYIMYQNERALSTINEDALSVIADQFGVPYEHRSADSPPSWPDAPATTISAEGGEVGDVTELYWIGALVIVLLLACELARATILILRLRGNSLREGAR